MKRSSLLILAAIVLLATMFTLLPASIFVSPVSAGVNLIQNPGFEQPTGNGNQTPTYWTYSTTSPYRDFTNLHSGNCSAYLHGASGYYEQTVSNIVAGTIYRFEAYTRANAGGNETVTLEIRNSSSVVLDTYSWNGTDHGWARRTGYLTTPTNAWDAVITLSMDPVGGDPKAWFDDILLEEKTPSGCFIATAAYGSYLDGHVETLRDFRDQYLVTNPVGSALVSTYYKLSPPVAEFIDDHPALKPVVRVGLLPAVAMSTVAVSTTLAEKLAIVGSLALVYVALAVWLSRRRGKGVIS